MLVSPESARLRAVYEECKKEGLCKNSKEFASIVGTDQGSFSKMINGIYPISQVVVKNICQKLGYSPAWFIMGEGSPKPEKKEISLETQISMIQTELQIMAAKLKRLEAKVSEYERDQKS